MRGSTSVARRRNHCQWIAGLDLIHQLTWVALALLYGGAVLAVWSLVTYLRGVWVHFRWVQPHAWCM